jgi:hypothetical protein
LPDVLRTACTGLLAGLAALACAPAAAPGAEPGPARRPAVVAPPDAAAPAEPADPEAVAELFAMPAVTEEARAAFARFAAGDVPAAAAMLDALIARHPGIGALHATRAAVAILSGDATAALDGLEAAAAAGTDVTGLTADPAFAALAADLWRICRRCCSLSPDMLS